MLFFVSSVMFFTLPFKLHASASSAAPMSAVTAMERARISSGTLCGRSLTSAYAASGFRSVRIWNGY